MKYYIPTTNLNIDNLLSTESISPYAYYAERKFKPNYFEKILPSLCDSVLLLFSKIPSFELDDKEVEQYPIVLEIEDEQQLNDTNIVASCDEFTIYSCNHTIYLTPWNTHFLTFSIRGYEHSKIIIESSRNCKIGSKYIWKNVDNSFPLEIMLSKINIVTNVARISNDMQINVAKGALWGYIIGLSKSITPDAANLVKIANNMRNIVSSAISNSGICKPNFYERLLTLNEDYSKIADHKANEHWTKECSSKEISILEKFHVLKEAIIKFFRANNYSITPELPPAHCDKSEWMSYREHLSLYTQSYMRKASLFNLDTIDLDLLVFDGNDIKIKELDLINDVLRLICSGYIDKEMLRVNRIETMKIILSSVSTILSERYGKEKWAAIPDERRYINSLGKNIIDFQPFDINSINNDELIAIAAFILKGEDYDSLIRYLEDNGISNYRLVLTLWGALEGYASIHKNLVFQFVTPRTLNLINAFVGIKSSGELFPLQKQLSYSNINNGIIRSETNCNTKEFPDINTKLGNIKVGKKSLSKELIIKVSSIYYECNSCPNDIFYKKLSSVRGIGKSAINAIKESLGYVDTSFFSEDNSVETKESSEKSIIMDNEAKKYILNSPVLPDEIRIIITEIFEEFQVNYQSGYYYEHSNKYPRNNYNVIDHFIKWCLSTKNNKSIVRSQENSKIMDELKKYLLERYRE